jgi:hypothetical protein
VYDIRSINEYYGDVFDLVIDKGTIDVIVTGDNPTDDLKKILDAVYQVLKDNGYISLFFFLLLF